MPAPDLRGAPVSGLRPVHASAGGGGDSDSDDLFGDSEPQQHSRSNRPAWPSHGQMGRSEVGYGGDAGRVGPGRYDAPALLPLPPPPPPTADQPGTQPSAGLAQGGSLLQGMPPAPAAGGGGVAPSGQGGGYASHPPTSVLVQYAPNCVFNATLEAVGKGGDPSAAVYPLPFDVIGRAHLDSKKTWWPSKAERQYMACQPADPEVDEQGFRKAVKDLLKRDRAAVVKAGDGVHVWYFVPPKPELIREGVVPKSLQDKLLVVYGVEGVRGGKSKRRK